MDKTIHETEARLVTLNESSAVPADQVSASYLYNEEELQKLSAQALKIKNVITGVASFDLRGTGWKYFVFKINARVNITRAVVSLSWTGVLSESNAKTYYEIDPYYSVSTSGNTVAVFGRVYIEDGNTSLRQLSYNCTVI